MRGVIKFGKTSRGFLIGEFEDRYGAECSIQESSLATEACVWLGVDKDLNGEIVGKGRMHLTQEMARDLIPVLRYFARTGNLGTDALDTWISVGSWVRGVTDPYRDVVGRIVSVTNDQVTVQNDALPGDAGLSVTLTGQFDLIWEPTEDPGPRLSHIDMLLSDDDDE